MINKLGVGVFLAKSDIKSAFRLLPASPGDFDLLGFQFQNYIIMTKWFLLVAKSAVPFGTDSQLFYTGSHVKNLETNLFYISWTISASVAKTDYIYAIKLLIYSGIFVLNLLIWESQ